MCAVEEAYVALQEHYSLPIVAIISLLELMVYVMQTSSAVLFLLLKQIGGMNFAIRCLLVILHTIHFSSCGLIWSGDIWMLTTSQVEFF